MQCNDMGTPTGKVKALHNLIHAGDSLAVKMLKSFNDSNNVAYAQLMTAME